MDSHPLIQKLVELHRLELEVSRAEDAALTLVNDRLKKAPPSLISSLESLTESVTSTRQALHQQLKALLIDSSLTSSSPSESGPSKFAESEKEEEFTPPPFPTMSPFELSSEVEGVNSSDDVKREVDALHLPVEEYKVMPPPFQTSPARPENPPMFGSQNDLFIPDETPVHFIDADSPKPTPNTPSTSEDAPEESVDQLFPESVGDAGTAILDPSDPIFQRLQAESRRPLVPHQIEPTVNLSSTHKPVINTSPNLITQNEFTTSVHVKTPYLELTAQGNQLTVKGITLTTQEKLSTGEELHMRFTLPQDHGPSLSIQCSGLVRNQSRAESSVKVRFLDLRAHDRAALKEYLERHSS
jgi:hypothetical protein